MTTTAPKTGGTTGQPAASRDGSPSEMDSDDEGFASEPPATAGDIESLTAGTSPESPDTLPSHKAVRRASVAVIGLGSDLRTIARITIEPPEGGRMTWTTDERQDRTDEQLLEEVRKRIAP